MSSTNRGGQRVPADHYPTPAWCVTRLLEAVPLPGGRWLEPCAGRGAIIQACNAFRTDLTWSALELRGECQDALRPLTAHPHALQQGDLRQHTDWLAAQRPAVIITNPPFRHAQEMMTLLVEQPTVVILLLRLNFLASARRAPFMHRHPPDVYVLPNRPSFVDGGKTDSVEYAWFVWHPDRAAGSHGRLQVLATTPSHIRRPK